eukprot:m51a1_g3477 hypothetical protein (341) ;mRNA; f:763782-764909
MAVVLSSLVLLAVLAASLLALRAAVRRCGGGRRPPLWLSPDEPLFRNFGTSTGTPARFPDIRETPRGEVSLSVVVPAYNEERRLPLMLDEAVAHLVRRSCALPQSGFTWEIVVVDDGSTDRTARVALDYAKTTGGRVRLLRLERNRGKGGAVLRVSQHSAPQQHALTEGHLQGMHCSRGRLLLMADADGATRFSDMDELEKALLAGGRGADGGELEPAVAVGSRAHAEDVRRTALRMLLMWGFHLAVRMCVGGVRDTQCGFKMFTRAAARELFPSLHIERWAFDVELLFLARRASMPVVEVPVHWHEVDGSKLSPFWATLQMVRDLARIKFMYLFGIWTK